MTLRVLVVDDDFMVARVHRGYVERVEGFAVVGEAHTGAEALAAARDLHPDLVLLDIYLPDMSGLDVLRALRQARGAPDVLAVTAARDVETVRTALQSGVVHYLVKPFSFAVLKERLERYATAHRRLHSGEIRGQRDVDRLVDLLRAPAAGALPKGLSEATLDLVAAHLRDAPEDVSALETADACGISRVSARRYLEHLVASGRAEMRPRYGGGRPEHRYRWAGA